MIHHSRLMALGTLAFGLALGAQAGPAQFSASFVWHAWGNDITNGTQYPYNEYVFSAQPLGHDCQSANPYTPNGSVAPRYCGPTTIQAGAPATGSGYLVTGGAGVGSPIGLARSTITASVTGFNPSYYPYLQSATSARFGNEAGTFFAGSGPAFGKGTIVKTGMGQTTGTWIIREGDRGFGGVMGLLGFLGSRSTKWVVPGKVGTYINTGGNWGMVTPIGRPQYATPTALTPMGKATNWKNPHTFTDAATNHVNSNMSTWIADTWGTPWTTGAATIYLLAGNFPMILRRSGHDTVTDGGVRNTQLVTPMLTHGIGTGYQNHTGQMGILTLRITPESGAILMLAAGVGVLLLMHRTIRRG